MNDKIIIQKERRYEVYTCSGNRITVDGSNMIIDIGAGDLFILDKNGEQVAQFVLMNIEGWRVAT